MKVFKTIENTNFEKVDAGDVIGHLKNYAPIIIAVLGFVKIWTGDKGDEKIDQIIAFLKAITMTKKDQSFAEVFSTYPQTLETEFVNITTKETETPTVNKPRSLLGDNKTV